MRAPDMLIGPRDDPYMRRWYLIPRNRVCNVYLHHFMHSDDDRALHSHPWLFNVSILLKGRYLEHSPSGVSLRVAPTFKFRWGAAYHRIELIDRAPVWTLFITGPKVREWGFRCPQGFVHWRAFTSPENKGEIGRGCDQ
jgi:hypothetical protein